MSIITATQLAKTFHRGQEAIHAVDGVDIEISQGEFVSFVGPSGSGKTTLLHLLGCLDTPTDGSLKVNDQLVYTNAKSISERELTSIRRRTFGYIFQKFYLIPTLTVQENILLPFAFNAGKLKRHDMGEIAATLGLEKRLKHLPSEISGGEMQRVAIARALVSDPKVILADEPTG
ncbi:MAG: ABC transporter ATP-binding protein, partial [Candidatus Cloacimonetes bacterium]|nr:ABC transporter ATP-binding protein [Candidatus Cloacimonadota bacterium]